jgi:hypothetical protein
MRITKRLAATLLAFCMIALMIPDALAEESSKKITASGSNNSTPVTVTATAASFDVTIPTSLPISISATGAVTGSTAAITNNSSAGGVKVTNVSMEAAQGWTLVDFSSSLSSEKIDAKKLGFQITAGSNSVSTGTNGALNTEPTNWTIDKSGSLSIAYTGISTPVSTAILNNSETAATVTFTVAWDAASSNT